MIDCHKDCERYPECDATQKCNVTSVNYCDNYIPKAPLNLEKLVTDVESSKWCSAYEPKEKDGAPTIKDSGERREFETGAVRDIQEGKGRCDLLPLDVVSVLLTSKELRCIESFRTSGNCNYIIDAINVFIQFHTSVCSKEIEMLELAKHFEEGAKKYGEYNWQKGIPIHCYIDSAIRHYLKFKDGWTDEPHDRAFVWNLVCCIWTMQHHPELDDYTIKKEKSNENN